MKKILLMILGFLALGLGAIGIAIPVLPTTPFVLVAAGCFATANPKLYLWLSKTKYFGEFITNYKNKTGVSKEVKTKALLFLYITLGISFVLFPLWYVRLILAVVAVGVTIHILLLRSKETQKAAEENASENTIKKQKITEH